MGEYAITPSGASSANYDIDYVAGTQTVTPAPLTITADSTSKVYGAKDPAYTVSYDGLVNGDTTDEISGLTVAGPPSGSDAGTYAVSPSGATDANYAIAFAAGTLTITRAPLTIRPANVAVPSGGVPTYTWSGDGWVNGDTDATLARAGRTGPRAGRRSALRVSTPPRSPAPAPTDPNYTIGYATADLRVDPLLSLDAAGLPTGVVRRASVDGATVDLPVVDRVLRYGTAHRYRFVPVLRVRGHLYVTTTASFDGPVSTNLDVTATYRTMRQLLRRAEQDGGVDQRTAKRLGQRWDKVEGLVAPRKKAKLLDALHQFAHLVRQGSGSDIRADVARDLLAHARLVYQRYGGTGTV